MVRAVSRRLSPNIRCFEFVAHAPGEDVTLMLRLIAIMLDMDTQMHKATVTTDSLKEECHRTEQAFHDRGHIQIEYIMQEIHNGGIFKQFHIYNSWTQGDSEKY